MAYHAVLFAYTHSLIQRNISAGHEMSDGRMGSWAETDIRRKLRVAGTRAKAEVKLVTDHPD